VVVEADRSGVNGIVAGDHVEQCGLAAAVRPDEAVYLAGPEIQRHLGQRDETAEVL